MTTWVGARGLCGALAAARFLGLAHPALAWDQPQWVRQLGTADYDQASGVATDADGNVYIAGYSGGRFGSDAWVAKYSAAGALRWKRQVATADVVVSGVATDGDGNVYIAGYTRGSLGEPDAWVAKYSATGALRWERQFGTAESNGASGVASGADGNVYIAGWIGEPQPGETDAWVAKYSAAGALRWRRQLATADDDYVSGVASDVDGNAYIAGYARSLQGFDNAWVAKYSTTGGLRWKRQLGTRYVQASGVAADRDGSVYITGTTLESLGGPSRGSYDAWLAKYSAAGALRWKRQFGTSEPDNAYSVATDRGGSVYIAGSTRGSFGGPFQGGYWDAWVAKYSATGASGWKRQLGTSESDVALGVATDEDRNVCIAGVTTGSLGGPNQGDGDAWIAKYSARR